MSPFNRRPCPLPWWAATKNIKSMENEFWGGRFRGESLKVVNVAFVYQRVPSQKHNYDFHVKGIIKDLAFDFV